METAVEEEEVGMVTAPTAAARPIGPCNSCESTLRSTETRGKDTPPTHPTHLRCTPTRNQGTPQSGGGERGREKYFCHKGSVKIQLLVYCEVFCCVLVYFVELGYAHVMN
ncbi:hypothetical protein NQD34_010236 [Periophthalmus magnuspinnatus]|nr:hypothetical protein NQD34_010236 [Periophthalmus magnuspinnatus]